MKWQDALLRNADRILKTGGELHFTVSKRGEERFSFIKIYPDNKIQCDTETVIDED